MPKSKPHRSRMFREFSKTKSDYLKANYLKNFDLVMRDIVANSDISISDMKFLLFAYDYEFFTLDHMATAYKRSKLKLAERTIYPLVNIGYLYKHFDRYAPSDKMEDLIFRNETLKEYSIRYAVSQKGRLMVAKFYRKMEGEEKISIGDS